MGQLHGWAEGDGERTEAGGVLRALLLLPFTNHLLSQTLSSKLGKYPVGCEQTLQAVKRKTFIVNRKPGDKPGGE